MSDKTGFFDTNVAVAAAIPDHPHHVECHARMAKLHLTGGACAAHSLAEIYTTLTHVNRYALPPSVATEIVKDTSRKFTIVSLSAAEYLRAIQAAADLDVRGPMLYDALLIACARKINARWIYTKNLTHFRHVAPDLASRIIEP
jgi:predicted nucleic acid-binding protein